MGDEDEYWPEEREYTVPEDNDDGMSVEGSSSDDIMSKLALDSGVIMPEGGLGSPCVIKVRF